MLEAGLGFAVKTAKGDFLGRDAVLRKQRRGPDAPHGAVPADRPASRCCSTTRPIVRDGKIVGDRSPPAITATSSAARSAWATCPARARARTDVLASSYEIEIAGERHEAMASLAPMYDPKAERVRA